MCKRFGILPRFLQNFLESEIFVCSVIGRIKPALGIIQFWFIYFRGIWRQGTRQHEC